MCSYLWGIICSFLPKMGRLGSVLSLLTHKCIRWSSLQNNLLLFQIISNKMWNWLDALYFLGEKSAWTCRFAPLTSLWVSHSKLWLLSPGPLCSQFNLFNLYPSDFSLSLGEIRRQVGYIKKRISEKRGSWINNVSKGRPIYRETVSAYDKPVSKLAESPELCTGLESLKGSEQQQEQSVIPGLRCQPCQMGIRKPKKVFWGGREKMEGWGKIGTV